ncbi:Bud site selection protein 6 [Coemansia biformis]|uniref:Bud site selection protein 6 n=1 Tax=Coemansia biformis TaxID=1286918 RepID=A0A9W8CZH1_9FUNG|nr:Bud site selection protein 6 [Coemansia biformis]
MDRSHVYVAGAHSRSPEPAEYAAAMDPAARPLPRAYGNYSYSKAGAGFGPAPSGSLRTTRSAHAYARNEVPSSMQAQGPTSVRHGPLQGQQAYDGSEHAAYNAAASRQQQQQQQRPHLQPYVADASERRTQDYLVAQTMEYGYRSPPSMPSGPVVTTYPSEYAARKPVGVPTSYRRSSIASSKSGYDGMSGRGTPTERYHASAQLVGGAKTAAAAASQRVEFGFTSPAMATLEHSPSPEDDEIADIIADMTKTRISADGSPIRVFLQLGDDTKRAELSEEPTHTALVNLFIEKYRGRLADDPDALPSVYVKDPKAGVFYELEDMADVVDGATLCWHTQPLGKNSDGDGPGDAAAAPAGSAKKEQSTGELAAVVAALADTVAQLPAQLKAELAATVEEMKSHVRASGTGQAAATESASAAAAPSQARLAKSSVGPAVAIARSASMPAVGDAGETDALRRQLQKAELELGVERQLRREAEEAAAAEKGALAAELEKLRTDVGRHPNVLRVRIEEGKGMLKAKYRTFNSRFEDVHSMVQEMRKDVAQRGSIPSDQMIRKAGVQLKEIEAGAQELVSFINDTRADWKRTWEEELQNILNEQSFVKDVEQLLSELLDDTNHLDGVLDKLRMIISLKLRERSQNDYVPPAATRFIDVVPPDDIHDAKKDFLKQISCVDIDHSRRVDALKAAERLRLTELTAKVNEFDEELSEFVTQRRLRKTGGTEELERRRAEKDLEVMRDMLKSVEEAEFARRAKIAQRKTAKKPVSKKQSPAPSTDPQPADPSIAEAPTTDKPSVDGPSVGAPGTDLPAADSPAADPPAADPPAADAQSDGTSAAEMQVDGDSIQ